MNKVTKKGLEQRINLLSTENSELHEYLMRIKRALKSIDIDILSKEFAKPKPKLKQLDQSVFDGLDAKWRFAAVDKNGEVWLSTHKTQPSVSGTHLSPELKADSKHIKGAYDTTDWQNSLIERDKVELTGSDLARAMLARGDKYVTCYISQTSEKSAKDVLGIVIGHDHAGFRVVRNNSWSHAVPINNQGEPLTAAEAGL